MEINKNLEIHGLKFSDLPFEPVKELKPLCRQLAAEGSVLLKNDGVLPLKNGTKIALFGRIQEGYIKSGTDSRGLVNVENAPCILESFSKAQGFIMDDELVM